MAVPPPPTLDKPAMRRALRAARHEFVAALDHDAKAARLAAITLRLTSLLDRKSPIAGYVAQGDEPDILTFLLAAHERGHVVALPAITRTAMTFGLWQPGTTLDAGYSGIPQPDARDPIVPAVLLTPLLGFDRRGNRLGQGGGFYDRWFAAHPAAMRIGVAWSVQEMPALATEAWDMPLHAIVTEQEWIAIP